VDPSAGLGKKTMFQKSKLLSLLGALAGLSLAPQTQAQVTAPVISYVANETSPGLWAFNFSVSIPGTDDFSIISVTDAPAGDGLIASTLTAPADFAASYDSGLGILDFIEGTQPFMAGSVTDGFTFQTTANPFAFFTTFEALTVNGGFATGSIVGTVNPIPEPAHCAAVFVGVAGLLIARKRMNRAAIPA
jgi:hypothetical protein